MTSKDVLFFGLLLLLLLVTSCIGYFWDRYNPEIVTVTSPAPTTLAQVETTALKPKETNTSPFIRQIPITTLQTVTDETNRSQSVKTTASVHSIQPKKETGMPTEITSKQSSSKQHPLREKRIASDKKRHKTKRHITVTHKAQHIEKASHRKTAFAKVKPKRKVEIESVLDTRELSIDHNAKLSPALRTYLSTIAHKAYRDSRLKIRLVTSDIDERSRIFLQKIRRYLIARGAAAKQIELKIKRKKQNRKYVVSNQKRDTIEVSLIERI